MQQQMLKHCVSNMCCEDVQQVFVIFSMVDNFVLKKGQAIYVSYVVVGVFSSIVLNTCDAMWCDVCMICLRACNVHSMRACL